MTWQHTIVIASHCVGLTFPGMMEEPGSLAGKASSPKPQRGPEPSVVGDFHQRNSQRVQGARGGHDGIVGGQLSELVLGRTEGQTGYVGDFIGDHLGEERVSVEAGSNGGATESEFKQVVECEVQAPEVGVELGHPARGFLPEGQGDGVHQMRATDLDDVGPLCGFGVEGVAQGANAGQQTVGKRLGCGDVHGGGKGVVGRLGAINVVVGVDGRLGPQLAACKFNGSIGDDFVGVHVRLRTASGLPNAEGKVVVEASVNDVLGSGDDEVADFRFKLLEGHVGFRCRLLKDSKRTNDALWHGVVTDVEIQE
jgi:hypothetical protein